jgi:UDP-glucose 4-epimerase
MTRILITGVNSFIGKNFIRFSQYKDISVVSLKKIAPSQIDFSVVDTVLHLSAIVHVFKNIDTDEYYRINRDLSIDLAKCAKSSGVKHFIFMSTIKVYGDFVSGSSPWDENSVCYPTDPYGKSKFEAENELKKLVADNFCVSVVRTPIVYGPGMKANMLNLVKLVSYCPVLPLGKINNQRNYTYIENLVGFIDRIIYLRLSGTFIAMDENAVSTSELINYISDSMGKKVLLFKLPESIFKLMKSLFPKSINRLYGSFELNNSLTRSILSFNPQYSTREGIDKMILTYKKASSEE